MVYTTRAMIHLVKNFAKRLILRSQEYTGTDNIYVARGGFWLSLGFSFNTLVSLGMVIAFANLLPKETYGTYKYILSVGSLFGFLTLTGMNTAVTRMVAKGHAGVFPYSVRLQLRWNMLYLVAGLAVSTYYALHANWLLAGGIGLLALTFPFSAAMNTYGAYLSGKRDFRRATAYGILTNLSQSACIFTALLLFPSVLTLIIAYSLGLLVPMVWFCVRLMRSVREKVTPEDATDLKRYAGHLSLMNVISTIDSYLDKILLFQHVGAVQLATYSIALAAPERIRGYMKNLGGMLMPRLAERSIQEIRRSYYTRIGQSLLIGAAGAGLYWITAPLFFSYILPQYKDALPFSRMLGLVNIFIISASYQGGIFHAQRMVRTLYYSSIGAHSVRILLYLILTPLYGIWGLVVATLSTHVLGTIYNIILWEYEVRKMTAEK